MCEISCIEDMQQRIENLKLPLRGEMRTTKTPGDDGGEKGSRRTLSDTAQICSHVGFVAPDGQQELLLFEQWQRGGAIHSGARMLRRYATTCFWLLSGAPMLRRYTTTCFWLLILANVSAVLP